MYMYTEAVYMHTCVQRGTAYARSCTLVDLYVGGTETAYMYTALFQNTTQVYMYM